MPSFLYASFCLAAVLQQLSHAQTVEDCLERITKNVLNNPNVDLPPEAIENILKPCKHQGLEHEQGNQTQNQSVHPSVLEDDRYVWNRVEFDDYHSFLRYAPASRIENGFLRQIKGTVQWLMNSAMRDVVSFEAEIFYAHLQEIDPRLKFLKDQISFDNKKFLDYLQSLMRGINERQLWAFSSTFGNSHFEHLEDSHHRQTLLRRYESFGGGGGFGVQIYCENTNQEWQLIFNGGAGGGGGYNSEDTPALGYGGGGGIQLHNDSVSVGGGTGYEHSHRWIIDEDADLPQFYGSALPQFAEMLSEANKCEQIRVSSGGGSGAGFSEYDSRSQLIGFTEYKLSFVLGETPKMTYISKVIHYLSVIHEMLSELYPQQRAMEEEEEEVSIF